MSLTPLEFERRRTVVGASECGLLFGLPSFGGRTLSDLWFEKKYGTVHGGKGNASTSLGTKLEPFILSEAEEHFGTKIVDRQRWVVKGPLAATLDGRLESTGAVIDAKTSGLLGPHKLSEWGEQLSDDCPDMYVVQILCQMVVTGAEMGHLAALIGGRGFGIFNIQPQVALMQEMETRACDFIESLKGDTPPEDLPQLDTLKRLKRQPNKVLSRSDEFDAVYQQFEEAKATAKTSEEEKERLQRQLLSMLQDCEAAECKGGLVTYYEQSRKESFVAASTFRVLRFKKD